MKSEELKEKLRLHKKWLNSEIGGEKADLSGADLSEANLSGADLSGADLSEANLSGADLSGANLYGADLYGANLSGADLYGADLSGANLYGANLSGANLYGANLSGANLSGANLYGANLYGADLSGAKSIISFGPMPTSGRIIYASKHEGQWKVQSGCFWGTLDELEFKVKLNHNCPFYIGVINLLRNTK